MSEFKADHKSLRDGRVGRATQAPEVTPEPKPGERPDFLTAAYRLQSTIGNRAVGNLVAGVGQGSASSSLIREMEHVFGDSFASVQANGEPTSHGVLGEVSGGTLRMIMDPSVPPRAQRRLL